MDYLQNHCWCSDSNWGGMYDCRHLVTLSSYRDNFTDDWNNLVCYDEHKVLTLNDNVLQWLTDNVLDTDKPYNGNTTTKGWCIGSLEYRKNDSCSSFSIFFQRRKDAMAFIKRWSKWKKPLQYCQYFTDVRKKLDVNTGKYV